MLHRAKQILLAVAAPGEADVDSPMMRIEQRAPVSGAAQPAVHRFAHEQVQIGRRRRGERAGIVALVPPPRPVHVLGVALVAAQERVAHVGLEAVRAPMRHETARNHRLGMFLRCAIGPHHDCAHSSVAARLVDQFEHQLPSPINVGLISAGLR